MTAGEMWLTARQVRKTAIMAGADNRAPGGAEKVDAEGLGGALFGSDGARGTSHSKNLPFRLLFVYW